MIAETLSSLDARIRMYPPVRKSHVDYSWDWEIIGDAAYVTHIDPAGAAKEKGLKVGDKVISIEGLPVDRSTYRQIQYLYDVLSPQGGLRVLAKSPEQEPRWLAVDAKIKPVRQWQGDPVLIQEKARKYKRAERFRDIKNHIRMVGDVMVWQGKELYRRESDIADGLKILASAKALILDLRGNGADPDFTLERLIDGISTERFDICSVKKEGIDRKFKTSGRGNRAFAGTVLVLVDARTKQGAEIVARTLQQHQRAVIMGDKTSGQVFLAGRGVKARGVDFNFNGFGLEFPMGEISLADGTSLDGVGVTPDYLLLPKPVDLAADRDVVLAKALAMLKQSLAPEAAYQLFLHDEYDDLDELPVK